MYEGLLSKRVCIVGMGYVGLTLAVGLAKSGYSIVGIENNVNTLSCLRAGRPHFSENGLEQLYSDFYASKQIQIDEKLTNENAGDVYIITVGTPVGQNKIVSLTSMVAVSRMISSVLKSGDLVIIRSTVKIGTTRSLVKPILDKANVPYCLAMCPERTVEGFALEELVDLPQLVAGIDGESAKVANAFFSNMCRETVIVSDVETCELAKLVCNTQRDLYFAYANEVAIMADSIGVNANEVIHAANYNYKRSSVANPGLVGGPCLEKDAYILKESFENLGYSPSLIVNARKINETVPSFAVESVCKKLESKNIFPSGINKVAVLGLAFKGVPETDDMRGSLAKQLQEYSRKAFPNAIVTGFDPISKKENAKSWGINATNSLQNALENADLIFIQTNHKFFKTREFIDQLVKNSSNSIIYDFWNNFTLEVQDELSKSKIIVMSFGSCNIVNQNTM